jgi:hypothetical protein
MKLYEVMLRAMAKKITRCQAAETPAHRRPHLQRWRQCYRQFGF